MLITLFAMLLSQPSFACAEHAQAAEVRAPAATGKAYGKGVTSSEPPLSLSEALQRRDEFSGKDVVVKAEVGQVCQSKGCWIMLKEGDSLVRVTFKDYSFFVPKDSAKRTALVQGKIFEKEITAAEARHYAKDEGKSAAEVKKITQGQKSPWFEATGLVLQ